MKKFEKIVAVLSVIAVVMTFLHVQGANILMMLTFGTLATFYYLFSFALLNNIPFRDIFKREAYKGTNWKRIAVAICTGYALSVVFIGILFKLLYLPGAFIMLIVGITNLFIIFIIAIVSIIKYVKTHSRFYVGVLVRSVIVGGLGASLFLLSNSQEKPHEIEKQKFSEAMDLSNYENTFFLPTLEHEIDTQNNSVYCVTLLYAWEEVRKQINMPLIISHEYTDLLLLNNSKSFINVLKNNEYSATGSVNGDLITARAEFYKSLPLETKLNSYDNKLIFKGEPVASFGIHAHDEYEQRKTVRIVYYKNDNNFILKLLPKDKEHEIILFKTDKVFQSMAEMNAEISRLSKIGKEERKNEKLQWKYYFATGEDEVVIPKFNFNIETNYASLEDNLFKTSEQDYRIVVAWQRTAFLLDENGAEIESEAVIKLCIEEEEEYVKPRPKKMRFDKDFLLLLKRADSQNPYFGLWVVNTELMEKE